MKISELILAIESVVDSLTGAQSFYFIEPWGHTDAGNPAEYPKVILVKPLNVEQTERLSTYNLELEFLKPYILQSTDTTLLESIQTENAVIAEMEDLANSFLITLRDQYPVLSFTKWSLITVHNSWADGVSGVSLSLQITTGNKLC